MSYRMLADAQREPSLQEMTIKALEILRRNDRGYVLLVEGMYSQSILIAKTLFKAFLEVT